MGLRSLRIAEIVRSHAAIVAPVVTLVALTIHPIPWCFDCEFPNPWGHVDTTNGWDMVVLAWWLVIASALAGFLAIRRSCLVPIGIVLAHLATQRVGGVEWPSLWNIGSSGALCG